MNRRAAIVTALLLGLLVPAAPASAAERVAISGRVLDETGRGVASATVRLAVAVEQPGVLEVLADGLSDMFRCLFSFFFSCSDDDEPTERVVHVTARTDRTGRYVLRFEPGWQVKTQTLRDIEITRAALVRGTLPPLTKTTVTYRGSGTLPTFRLWLRGATAEKVGTTHRRLRASVPAALGTPVRPPMVDLVQGAQTVWSYGRVPRARTVDARVAEAGTTGTQTRVTTKVGSRTVVYRSGVRPLTKEMRPLSRGKRCFGYRGLMRAEQPGCELTDGRLADLANLPYDGTKVVVDLGGLATPQAYVVRGCPVHAVAGSVEGEVYVDVEIEQKESRVYTGEPVVPVRYVRLDLDECRPTEVSVFGSPFTLPYPAPPAVRDDESLASRATGPGSDGSTEEYSVTEIAQDAPSVSGRLSVSQVFIAPVSADGVVSGSYAVGEVSSTGSRLSTPAASG